MKKNFASRSFDAVMTGVPTVIYVFFILLPCIAGLFVSLTDFGGFSLDLKYVGLYHYKKMFNDPVFYKSVWNYIALYVGTVLICFPLALSFAIILTRNRIKERNFYRVLFFFPSTVPLMIISLMWMVVYNPNFGILNQFLGLFGVPGQAWLGTKDTVMWAIIVMLVWRQFGFYLVFFMAGVNNIPRDLYESAKIDGAGEIRQTFYITIPLMWEVVRTSLVFYVQTACNVGFNIVYITTRGGPDNASQLLSSYMYQSITEQLDYGYASALGTALLVITTILALVVLRSTKREVYQY
ncbi:MAG: sugar ABC transporter permease [Clostridiaceae bacterium]|nr:sugar ABC transporter permease [Clostridiaceae bacterium]